MELFLGFGRIELIRLISITLAGLAACSTAYAAAAAPIYAVCTKTASPDLSTYQLYKVPPKTINEVAKDIVMGGIAGMMVEKPDQESYVIKPDLNRIDNPDGTTNFGGSRVNMTDTLIEAISTSKIFKLNRLTGEMSITVILSNETIKAWEQAHGGKPPQIATWHYRCKKAEPRL